MVKINLVGSSSIVFDKENEMFVFPTNHLFLISNDESEAINVRLKSSRKNILTFNFDEVENISASSANDMIMKISDLINK